MKKLLLTIVCSIVLTSSAFAQDIFKQGDLVLNAGVGFGNTVRSESYLKTTVPPVSVSLEYCIKDNLFDDKSSIGVGLYAGYFSQKWKNGAFGSFGAFDNLDLKYSDFIIGARGALHYQFVEKLDTYAGATLGYDIVSASGDYGDFSASSSAITAGVFVGARYYLSDKFAVNAELGYDIAILTVGVSYKF